MLVKDGIKNVEAMDISRKYADICRFVFDEFEKSVAGERKLRIESDKAMYLDRNIYDMVNEGILLPEYIFAIKCLISIFKEETCVLSPKLVAYVEEQDTILSEMHQKTRAAWDDFWGVFCAEHGGELVNAAEDYAKASSLLKYEVLPTMAKAVFANPEEKKQFIDRLGGLMHRKSNLIGQKVDKAYLAAHCKVSATAVGKWLNSENLSSIMPMNIAKLAQVLDTETGYLTGATDDFKDYTKEPGASSKIQIYSRHVGKYDFFTPEVKKIVLLLDKNEKAISGEAFSGIIEYINKIIYRKNIE